MRPGMAAACCCSFRSAGWERPSSWAHAYPVLALKRVYAASWWLTLVRAGLLALLHLLLIALGLLTVLVLGAIGD